MEIYANFYIPLLMFLNFMDIFNCDPCSENKYSVIDDYRRSPNFRSSPSERRLCDNKISNSWHRFKINGSNAEIPTKCVPNGCGTRAPLWLTPPTSGLPLPGKKARSHACATFQVPGRPLQCCGLQIPIAVKNCGDFFVYRLRSTKGCDLAYCSQVVSTVCNVGQIYVLHLQKCVDIVIEISKPRLHVKRYPDRVSVVCQFEIQNTSVSQHNPTFSVTWVKVRNGVSKIIRFKFLSDSRDQVILGKDVFTGDTVECEVMPVHQKQSQISDPLFLGIQVMESGISLRENGQPETLTLISTVPLICQDQNRKCTLDMVLSVKYPGGHSQSDVLLSQCLLEFHPNDRCQGIGCITQQVKVALNPNLYTLGSKDVHITGYLYVDEWIMWDQDSIDTKIRVVDLPSASCFVTAGVFIMSFQDSTSKISRRGTYILFKSASSDFEIHVRVTSCNEENLLCVCGVAVYFHQTRLTFDKCRPDKGDIMVQYHPGARANMKIYEGRSGKLIYVILDGKAHLRIDLREAGMSVTLQASGFYDGKAQGLCGIMGNGTSIDRNEIQSSLPFIDTRLLPGQSLFEKYEVLITSPSSNQPECDCSRSSQETSCPKSSVTVPQFMLHLTETTSYWLNKSKTTNQIEDYTFDGDYDDAEIVTKQPAKDGQLANDVCKQMFMTSGIAKTCLNKIKINIETVVNICVALATSYRNSTWMPEVLRLLENLCETHLSQEDDRTMSSDNDFNLDDVRQAILCPEGCYGNGICTDNGCVCNQGYIGVECLSRIELPTTTTERTTTVTTTTVPSTTIMTTSSTTIPSTSVTTISSTTVTSTTTTTTTTPTTIKTTTTQRVTTSVQPLTLDTCDKRSSRCSSVYVDLSDTSGVFALKCCVTLVQFKGEKWEPVGKNYTTLLRYVDSSTVECMLPMVTNGDNFVNIYRVQIPDGRGNMLKTQVLAVIDGLCQTCDTNGGCMLKASTCFIDRICYRQRSINPNNICLQCDSDKSTDSWSPRDNLPPIVYPNHSTIEALDGDVINTNISATDPEGMDLYYSTNNDQVTISRLGEFTWRLSLGEFTNEVYVLDGGNPERQYRLVVNITDSCGAVSHYRMTVIVKKCECQNGGTCLNRFAGVGERDVKCICGPSYTGKLCETLKNGCHSNPCYPGVACMDMTDSYRCGNCIPGYQGDGVTCTKKCSSQPCFPGVVCTDIVNSSMGFVCGSCPPYFYGNGEICHRNDEKGCTKNVCSALVSCEETSDYPGYRCGNCPHGYMGNGTLCEAFCFPPCTDGKECLRPGVCGCREGFTGTNCNQAICRVACQNKGICYQPDKCFCSHGYTGKYCETELCPHGCMNGGSCIDTNTCACLPGYRGHRCEIESCSITCLNSGTCVGFNRCQCTKEYKGIFCEQAVCQPDCMNGGACVRPGVCYCPIGFYGQKCENVFCYPPCKNGGYCLAGNQCQCQPGYTGSHCQFNYCLKNVCQNGGRCVGPDLCACRAGWEGQYCRRPTCHLGCQNGGYCYLPNRCRCQPGYWGPFCQFPSCYPRCGYGSQCTGLNQCSCRKYYTGKYCMRRKR